MLASKLVAEHAAGLGSVNHTKYVSSLCWIQGDKSGQGMNSGAKLQPVN